MAPARSRPGSRSRATRSPPRTGNPPSAPLREQPGVVALYGTYAPTAVQAVTPYLEQKGVPIIGGVSGNAVEETSPLVFNPQPGPSISPVGTVASIGAQMPQGQRNLAVIYCFE